MSKEKNNTGGSGSGVVYNSLTHGSKIIGKVIADKDFRVDGEIEGDIICTGKVVVGQKGILKGSIECTYAEILGKIDGKVNVTETLSLRENAIVNGDICTKVLIVEPKAVFNGTCTMGAGAAKEVSEKGK